MYSAIQIGNIFLRIARFKGKPLTPLQLVKLVYIAHGWSLVLRNQQLVSDDVQAWKYGPVMPSLYETVRYYGRGPITELLSCENEDHSTVVPTNVEQFVDEVFEAYGHLEGIALSNLTHKEGTPWEKSYVEGANVPISDRIIANHYAERLKQSASESATVVTQPEYRVSRHVEVGELRAMGQRAA